MSEMESPDPAAVQAILDRVRAGGQESRAEAAREIRRLTRTSSENRRLLSGAILPLVSMLRSGARGCSEAAVLALLNLAVQDERCESPLALLGILHNRSLSWLFLQNFSTLDLFCLIMDLLCINWFFKLKKSSLIIILAYISFCSRFICNGIWFFFKLIFLEKAFKNCRCLNCLILGV